MLMSCENIVGYRIQQQPSECCSCLNDRFSGDCGDALHYTGANYTHYHDGMLFTTYDSDNDKNPTYNCAVTRRGGWWFNNCFWGCTACDSAYSVWFTLPDPSNYTTATRMMLRIA